METIDLNEEQIARLGLDNESAIKLVTRLRSLSQKLKSKGFKVSMEEDNGITYIVSEKDSRKIRDPVKRFVPHVRK